MRLYYLLLAFLPSLLIAQTDTLSTAADQRLQAVKQRQVLQKADPAPGLRFINIGPSVQSGRVVDISVNPEDPTEFYVAYASGGLWHTANNGTSFRPLFQYQSTMTLGAVAVHWPTRTIYVGTGEVNSSRSSYAGDGLYKSTDGGENWTIIGLPETHHIGRIVIDAADPQTILVAALGHLYGDNPERGVFRSTDGGKTWNKTLFVNPATGVVELIQDPRKTNEWYAAAWQRTRRAWDFTESGPGSGIYHSTDNGLTWQPVNGGFPTGAGGGRIGLTMAYDAGGKRQVYASVDNYFRRAAEEPDTNTLSKEQLRNMPVADVLRLKSYLLEGYLKENNFPRDLKPETVRQKLESGDITPLQLVEYLEDANSLLFDTPVKGLEVYALDVGKKQPTWRRTHEDYLDDVYNSYGYYFGRIQAEPGNPARLYALGVPVITSADGGKTWTTIQGDNTHADHHALWVNPKNGRHLILGNDGGINISYDGGENWIKCNSPAVGQFYYIAADDHPDGYRVYGGLQDNGVWRGPGTYEPSKDWQQTGRYPYKMVMGGDGMQVAIDPRDHETIYTGFQFGNYFRINPAKEEQTYITPRHELGERPFRWNWQTPVHLSVHNPDILYMGSNFVHRSLNRGDDFKRISPDLTQGGRPGDVPYGTLSALHESPLRFGLLYAGSDDGLVHVSRDGGYSWQRITAGLPADLWVSRIQASNHDEGTVYLSLNGYRWDNFQSYVYRSTDYGQTWQRIGTDLPAEPVNVVKEDPKNAALLYVGTDHGLYASLNGGTNFFSMQGSRVGEDDYRLPAVPVHDVVVQSSTQDLLVGTHGRSIYKSSVKELQLLTAESREKDLLVFVPAATRASSRWGSESFYRRPEAPEILLPVYSKVAGRATVTISLKDGPAIAEFTRPLATGLNYLPYDFRVREAAANDYQRALNKDRKEEIAPVVLKKADDGFHYLRSGKYVIRVDRPGTKAEEVEWEVK
ncbi:MAG: glycosyl hydrolase [Saprospiraceae bacterium]